MWESLITVKGVFGGQSPGYDQKCLPILAIRQGKKFAALRSAVGVIAFCLPSGVVSAAEVVDLKVGDAAPAFSPKEGE